MENFIVSARKYRPTTFDDVVGQQALAGTLKRAIINHKLASAYLFCGPRGVGKTTCARIFAKAINCLHPHQDGEACNECESCVSFNEQRSLNIQELNAAANNSVDDIRQIIDQVRIPPQLGKYKVIILDEVHMLSPSASNALLKTLEEPPSYVIFILATTEKQKILPTILSRCQIFDFNRMEVNDIVGQLKKVAGLEGITYDERALNIIAQKADGGMRDSLSIFDQVTNFSGGNITYESVLKCLNVLDYDYYFSMTDALLDHQVSRALLLYNEIVNKGFNGGVFMGGLASHLRDLLESKDAETTALLDVAEGIRQQYVSQAQKCSRKFLYRAIRMCDKCSNEYKLSYNKRLSVEITLIEVSQLSDGDDSSGPGPDQKLKPLFKETAQTVSATPIPPAATPLKGDAAVMAQALKPEKAVSPTAPPEPAAKPRPKLIKTPSIMAALNENVPVKNEEKKPEDSAKAAASIGEEDYDLTKVNYYWKQYAKELPHEEAAVSGRMEEMELSVQPGNVVEVHVNNDMVKHYMAPHVPAIEQYLRSHLNNKNVSIRVKVYVSEKQTLRLNPKQYFQKLVAENEGFALLKEGMGLELD